MLKPGTTVGSQKIPPSVEVALGLLVTTEGSPRICALAARVGISKFHLSRLFVRYVGEAPHRHFRALRLEKAAQMLQAGRTAADVAYELGFCDQAHLCRQFKKRFGTSPGKYARRDHTTEG